jgi:hypothetical protein
MSKTTYTLHLTRRTTAGDDGSGLLQIAELVGVNIEDVRDEARLVRDVKCVAQYPRAPELPPHRLDAHWLKVNGHDIAVHGPDAEQIAETIRAAFAPNSRIVELPEPRDGCEWVQTDARPGVYKNGDVMLCFRERETVRLYDWAKTDPGVIVLDTAEETLAQLKSFASPEAWAIQLPMIWQPHDGSEEPPIDSESCIVELRVFDSDGMRAGVVLCCADVENWSHVASWRFVKLRDNVKWWAE